MKFLRIWCGNHRKRNKICIYVQNVTKKHSLASILKWAFLSSWNHTSTHFATIAIWFIYKEYLPFWHCFVHLLSKLDLCIFQFISVLILWQLKFLFGMFLFVFVQRPFCRLFRCITDQSLSNHNWILTKKKIH